ncbi:MAG: hypothetical protein R3C68_19405 [Myxococcota bacterium]
MLKRVVIVLAGLIGLQVLLAGVSVDTSVLGEAVQTEWWWSDSLALLSGSAMPPLVAIAAVLITRRLVLSLALGTLTAAFLVAGPNPLSTLGAFLIHYDTEAGLGGYVWQAIWDPFHASILVFTASLLGLVSVAGSSGGTQGVVDLMLRFAKGLRGARVATALMGTVVFFDDYANTAVVGPTMRPLFDRLRLSREKLAYIVDSTAAPVAGLALVSTWIGTSWVSGMRRIA